MNLLNYIIEVKHTFKIQLFNIILKVLVLIVIVLMLKYVPQSFDTPFYKNWILIFLLLTVGWLNLVTLL